MVEIAENLRPKSCKGCKHCKIPKELTEAIKSFKPVPGPYNIRYKTVGYLQGVGK